MYRAKVAGRESDRRQDLSMVDGRDGIALIARTARQTAGAGMGKNGRRHEMAAGEAEAVMAVAARDGGGGRAGGQTRRVAGTRGPPLLLSSMPRATTL